MRKKARIAGARALSPWVRELSLEVDPGPLAFTAGQWVNLHVPTPDGPVKRAYSIASPPSAPLLELAITRVDGGDASPLIHDLPVGTEVEIDGPHGFFTREGHTGQEAALFVATGTGLCPLRSMLITALAHPASARAPMTLLFGCRNADEILWRDELSAWAAQGVRVEVTLSRPGSEWNGRQGYVQRHVPELAGALPEPHVYICGLNRMVSEVRHICKTELGLDRKRIHSERYD